MMKSVLIRTDGTMKSVDPASLKQGWSLKELYTLLDCQMVEVIYPRLTTRSWKEPILICDEEGLGVKHYNHLASSLAGQQIVGDVILCESKSFQ